MAKNKIVHKIAWAWLKRGNQKRETESSREKEAIREKRMERQTGGP